VDKEKYEREEEYRGRREERRRGMRKGRMVRREKVGANRCAEGSFMKKGRERGIGKGKVQGGLGVGDRKSGWGKRKGEGHGGKGLLCAQEAGMPFLSR